mmetsp:Transcript_109220/g.308980  ORF Transcript_109220/g.308980 Transcript_109220/m.308980 type:complete len:136 (-) Transcript_109220:1541-1948(-)
MMSSALRIVERRCATTTKVCPSRFSRSACTTRSDSASSADVASSSRMTRGLAISARAMATRCFCPPLSCTPRSPTITSYFSGNFAMKSWQFASSAMRTIRSSDASWAGTPNWMFSRIVMSKSIGSCDTTATCRRR